jgi:hypothetical protein
VEMMISLCNLLSTSREIIPQQHFEGYMTTPRMHHTCTFCEFPNSACHPRFIKNKQSGEVPILL